MALKVVFMGTPAFAVPTFEKLVQYHNVLSVVTTPDKPAGRGLKLQSSAVKECAIKHNIPVLQPEKLKDPDFLQQLKNLNADVFVVVAFRMLPKEVWSMPPHGTFNLHASLLPKYRGAAPINFAIINGETETGVTTFKIQEQIDTGNIALQEKIAIDEKDTAGTLHDKMMTIGADLMIKTLELLEQNKLQLLEQDNSQATYAPKITKEFCQINWQQPSKKIYDFIRGLAPYPAAYTFLDINGRKTYCKILWAEKINLLKPLPAGTLLTDNKHFLRIVSEDGALDIKLLQAEGKRQMDIEEFLRGNKITSEQCIVS
ncbi:MAG: methionyl-tRNA formyltransferase [Bacteroidia bacterium]|nr:MAG: methionyl-tRNA formyltransferase [Bacteroidia bacterium]